MTKITKKEVQHIAHMSALELKEHEIDQIMTQLEQVLSYARRVNQVATHVEEPSFKNINVMRSDFVISQNPAPILAQAPEKEGNYFVVPKILDN